MFTARRPRSPRLSAVTPHSPATPSASAGVSAPATSAAPVLCFGGLVMIRGAAPASVVTAATSARPHPSEPLRLAAHAPEAARAGQTGTSEEVEGVWVALEEMLRRREAAMRQHPTRKG